MTAVQFPDEKTGMAPVVLEAPSLSGSSHSSRTTLEMKVLDDPALIGGIESAWRDLACGAESSAPFMQPEWIKAWWHVFGQPGQLRIVTVWNGARLVGVLPLMLSLEKRYGLPVRRLGALANDHSPRVDVLIAPDVKGVTEAIWRHIAATRREWDIFEVPRLLSKSPTLECLSQQARTDGFRFGLWQAELSPFIDLRTKWKSYLAERSKGFRRDIRRKWRRLTQLGHPALEIVVQPSAVAAALQVACEIEADGWKGRGGSAMQSIANVRSFYERLAEGMAERDMLRLHFLTLDGERIAFDLSIEVGGRIYSLKSGYRDAQAAASPGLMLLLLIVEHYMAQGKHEIDLLGEDDHFKRHWTRNARSHHWFICFSGSPRGRVIDLIKFGIMPRLKKIRARLHMR